MFEEGFKTHDKVLDSRMSALSRPADKVTAL